MKKLFCAYVMSSFIFSGLYAMKDEGNGPSKLPFDKKFEVYSEFGKNVQPDSEVGNVTSQTPSQGNPADQQQIEQPSANENEDIRNDNENHRYDNTCFRVTQNFLAFNSRQRLITLEFSGHPSELILIQRGLIKPSLRINWNALTGFLQQISAPARKLFFAYTNVATYLSDGFMGIGCTFPPDEILNLLQMDKESWSGSVRYRVMLPMGLKNGNVTVEAKNKTLRHWLLCMLRNFGPTRSESSEALADGLKWDDKLLDRLSEHGFMVKHLKNGDVVKILNIIPAEYRYLATLFIVKEFLRKDQTSFVFDGVTDGDIDEDTINKLDYNEIVLLLNESEREYLPRW